MNARDDEWRHDDAACPDAGVLAVASLDATRGAHAAALAVRLDLPLIELDAMHWRAHAAHGLLLLVDAQGLALGATGPGRMQPVRADFADPALLHRLHEPGARRQDLARAIGVPERPGLRVVDATAGWGKDSAVLAALGCEVLMVERNPVVALLLADALERARASAREDVRDFAARLRLHAGDARELLHSLPTGTVDVVLLDPMFPERSKSAAVRKEMQLFHQLVGDDADSGELLDAALACAHYRVVVKRPAKAPPLAGRKPSHAITGKATRFDVHALRRLR